MKTNNPYDDALEFYNTKIIGSDPIKITESQFFKWRKQLDRINQALRIAKHIQDMKNRADNGEVLECPFCGKEETVIRENTMWTGRRSQTLSVDVRHWCDNKPHKNYFIVKGQNEKEAIKAWNNRAIFKHLESEG